MFELRLNILVKPKLKLNRWMNMGLGFSYNRPTTLVWTQATQFLLRKCVCPSTQTPLGLILVVSYLCSYSNLQHKKYDIGLNFLHLRGSYSNLQHEKYDIGLNFLHLLGSYSNLQHKKYDIGLNFLHLLYAEYPCQQH